jgi:signal transduction histidine kinase
MSQKPLTNLLDDMLYRGRLIIAALSLVFVLYCATYIWFFVPHGGPDFLWRPDSKLIVYQIPAHVPDTFLELGDLVVAIDGQQPSRMRPRFPLPLRTEYEITVWRDGEVLTGDVVVYAPLTRHALGFLLPATLTALLSWLVGAIILFFARRKNRDALHSGTIFLLAAMVLIGIQASLEGTPGAWVAGHALIYFLAIGWVYLGFLPRSPQGISRETRRFFQVLLGVAGLLALTAVYEVVILFPQATSVQEQIGVSLYSLGFLLAALGLLACVSLLAWRVFQLPSDSYLRQQLLILLFFFSLGILPTMLLTVIPHALLDQVFLPFPVAISMMVLIPVGYLFVIYRRGFLGLDVFFSRFLYLTVLALGGFGFYASGLYLVQRWLGLEGVEALAPATVVFFPTLLVVVYAHQPVIQFVQRLVYGRGLLDHTHLAEFTSALSRRPEMGTLHDVLGALAGLLNAPQAALSLKDEQGRLMPVATIGDGRIPEMDLSGLEKLERPIVRATIDTARPQTLLQSVSWAEIVIPVLVRGELIGMLALSRPGQDGYYNAHQVLFLIQVAAMLAVTSENLYLFEATRQFSRKLLTAQERERKRVSRQLHDEPLQRVTYVTTLIDRILHETRPLPPEQVRENLVKSAQQLRTIGSMMREICQDLRSPQVEIGVDLAAQEIIDQFGEQHEGLRLYADIEKMMRPVAEDIVVTTCYILTESLNNVIKHAPAAEVYISLYTSDDKLMLEVSDTGPGSRLVDMTIVDLIKRQHLGIIGMYEWTRSVGGRLSFEANSPHGMRVCLQCPLA